MKIRTAIQALIIIAVAGLLISCSKKPDSGRKAAPAETRSAQPPATQVKTTPAPVETPKTQEAPAAQPAKEAAKEKGKLIVVTNEANYEKDKDVINFIATRGVTIERIAPSDFEKYKAEKYILVLGGPNEGDGLGDIAKQLLSPDEVNFVSQMGNKGLYLKMDKYSSAQQIIVIAGCDADATFRQFVNSKDKWWGYISSWFNIELSHDEVYGY